MKYLLLVHHNEEAFNKIPEGKQKELLAESIELCHQLDGKGQDVHAAPLQPEATGKVVRVRDGKEMVTDGPFMETTEQLAGYWIWQCKSKEEAIEWAKRYPSAGCSGKEGDLEIRQLFEAADFGTEFTPALREQEERIRAQVAKIK